ncbi:MAG: hypothetical protein AAB448_04280 [Patescibacteria group bacterium]
MISRNGVGLLRIAAHAVLSYIAYLLSVPAILLQVFALFCGVSGVLVLVLSYDPGLIQATLIGLLTEAGLTHVSYSVNPVSYILRWYMILAFIFDVIGSILHRLFPRVVPNTRQLFIWILCVDVLCYVLFGLAFLLSGGSFWPAVILFAVTVPFTALAFAASSLPRLFLPQASTTASGTTFNR